MSTKNRRKKLARKKKKRKRGEKLPHVLLELGALLAVVGVRHSGPAADDAASALAPVVALVADADEGGGTHEGVADDTLAVAYFFFGGGVGGGHDEAECCSPYSSP